MTDRPTAPELLEAVTEFLSSEVLPVMQDHRMKFRLLIALNALGIAYRELTAARGSEPLPEADLAALAHRIRAGDVPDDSLTILKEHVAGKLRISNPAYLNKYE